MRHDSKKLLRSAVQFILSRNISNRIEATALPEPPQTMGNRVPGDLLQHLHRLSDQLSWTETMIETITRQQNLALNRHGLGGAALSVHNIPVSSTNLEALDIASCPENPTTLWDRLSPSLDLLEEMKLLFWHAMLHGPGSNIDGVRKRTDRERPPIDLNPPNVLSLQLLGLLGSMISRVELPLMENEDGPNDAIWQKFDKLNVEKLLTQRPNGVPAFVLRDPGHFEGDWGFSRDACIVFIELSHQQQLPERVFWKYQEEDGSMDQGSMAHSPEDCKISGRNWLVCPQEPVMDVSLTALVFTQVVSGYGAHSPALAKCTMAFIRTYAGLWPEIPWTRWCFVKNNVAHLQFHLRFPSLFSTLAAEPEYEEHAEGMSLCRHKIQIPGPHGSIEKPITETRVSIAITTDLRLVTPSYTILTLSDSPELLKEYKNGESLLKRYRSSRYSMLKGVAVFQSVLHHLIMKWAESWMSTLDYLATEVSYDHNTSPGLNATLQSLSRWIDGTTRDLGSLRDDAVNSFQTVDLSRSVTSHWSGLVVYQQNLARELKRRIECQRSPILN